MRKNFLFLLIIVLTISCSTTGTVWDDSIPPEKSSRIMFWCFEPTSFNGIPIKLGSIKILTIPSGTINFEGDVKWSSSVAYFNYKDASFSCNLEGGKEYTAWTDTEYNFENKVSIWGIYLYHGIKAVGYPPKENLIKFIPFNPPVLTK